MAIFPPSLLSRRHGLALAGLLFLAACSGGEGNPSGVTLTVGDQMNSLQTALTTAGENKPEDYHIAWANFLGGPPIVAAQTGGSIDLGWMAETPLIFAQAAGSPVKVVAVSRSLTGEGSAYALVVRADSPIRTIADLKGKSVAYSKGTVLHYLVARLLDQQGLTLNDITTVQASGVGTGLLDKGAADAIALTEPFLTQLESAGKIRILATGAYPNTPGFTYLVASDAALADPVKARAIGDFIARAARAQRWQQENIAKAAPAIAKQYNVSPDLAVKIIERSPSRYAPLDASVIAAHQEEADLFLKLGLLREKLDASRIFDHRYDELVVADQVPS